MGLLMLLVTPVSGRADDLSSLVKLELTDCAAVVADEVNRILGLELQSIAAGHRDIAARPIRLAVTCTPGRLVLTAEDGTSERISSRRIQTDTHPLAGMERIIAIAAAELALSTWEQIFADAADTPPSPENKDDSDDRPPADAAEEVSVESAARTREPGRLSAALRISALWRMYLNGQASLFGGEIGGGLGVGRVFRVRLGIAPEGGRPHRALGDVSLFSASAAIAFGVHGRLFASPLQGGADIGFRGGYGSVRGRPQLPSSGSDALSGGFGGPVLQLSLASVTRPAVGLSVEVGYAFFGIVGRVDVGAPVAIRGPWLSVRLDCIFQRKRRNRRN